MKDEGQRILFWLERNNKCEAYGCTDLLDNPLEEVANFLNYENPINIDASPHCGLKRIQM